MNRTRARMLVLVLMIAVGATGAALAADDTNATAASTGALVPFTGAAPQATQGVTLLAIAQPTILLDVSGTGATISVPSTVTYHPAYDLYYASATGNPTYAGFVFGPAGGAPIDLEQPLNIDVRAWNYNSNTALLEVVSYDALNGGAARGLIQAQTDGSGLLTGGTATLLASMPGNNGSQTAPAYDPAANVFFSRNGSNVVNVVNRSDGSLASTFNLDFASAGVTSVPDDGMVFVPELGAVGVLDEAADTLSLFDLGGAFLATVAIPFDVTDQSRRPGYANGQLFVWDDSLGGWQGLTIFGQPLIQDIPALSGRGLAALALLLIAAAIVGLRLRRG